MGIKSTKYVSREWAEERLSLIYSLAVEDDYAGIEKLGFEESHNSDLLVELVSGITAVPDFRKWTDLMVEKKLDEAYIRKSMFDNYYIGNEPTY